MLIRIVSILFPLFAITAVGYFVGRRSQPDLTHANKLNMDVFIPSLVFAALAGKDFQIGQYLPLLAATLAVVIGSGLAGWGIARAVVLFMVSNLMHFSFGAWLLDHHIKLTNVWKVPSVLASIAGLSVSLAGIQVWPPLMVAIKMLGDVSIPLMLFGLGVRLTDSKISAIGLGIFGAVARPVVGMALVGLLLLIVPLPPIQQALLLVFGALPPAVLNFIFAERYRQEPEKVASIVLIGNVASVVFLPIALALALP